MKKLVLITALASGILLILGPRFIFPACEYEGYPRMHCSDTASAEYIIGFLLVAVGGAVLFLKKNIYLIAAAACSIVLLALSYWLPDKLGYCRSSRMPCTYGMVPGIHFIDRVAGVLMSVAIVGISKRILTKGAS